MGTHPRMVAMIRRRTNAPALQTSRSQLAQELGPIAVHRASSATSTTADPHAAHDHDHDNTTSEAVEELADPDEATTAAAEPRGDVSGAPTVHGRATIFLISYFLIILGVSIGFVQLPFFGVGLWLSMS